MEKEKNIYFWGCKLNEYELKNYRLSYATVAKQFDCILCNNIYDVDYSIFDNIKSGCFYSYYYKGEEIKEEQARYLQDEKLEEISSILNNLYNINNPTNEQQEQIKTLEEETRAIENMEELQEEIFQYFIVSDNALWYLKKMNELVFYSDKLDCYIWGVTHWGTSWDYVLTNLKLNEEYNLILENEE